MQPVGDAAAGAGLAAAGLAGEQADAAQLQQVVEAGVGFAGVAGEELPVGRQGVVEGEAGESEVAAVHQRGSLPILRRAIAGSSSPSSSASSSASGSGSAGGSSGRSPRETALA